MAEPRDDFRTRATRVIDHVWGGLHHVQKITWTIGDFSWCEFRIYGTVATWNHDELTRLVLAAHAQCVRAEIRPAMRDLKVILSDRDRYSLTQPIICAHPFLDDHLARLRGQIDGRTLAKRMAGPSTEEGTDA